MAEMWRCGNCVVSNEGDMSTVFPVPDTDGVLDKTPFQCCDLNKNVVFEQGCVAPEDCSCMFYPKPTGALAGDEIFKGAMKDRSDLESIDLSGLDTSNVTDMSRMFEGCNSLTDLNVSGFDTSNVTNMGNMFFDCQSITNLDVSGFDTSNVTNMSGMFGDCISSQSLDVSGFDTSKVTDMNGMFWCCYGLNDLDVSGFDTSNMAFTSYGTSGMFHGCDNLPFGSIEECKEQKRIQEHYEPFMPKPFTEADMPRERVDPTLIGEFDTKKNNPFEYECVPF